MDKLTCDAKTTLALIDCSIYTELGSYEKRSIQCSILTNGIVESWNRLKRATQTKERKP